MNFLGDINKDCNNEIPNNFRPNGMITSHCHNIRKLALTSFLQ